MRYIPLPFWLHAIIAQKQDKNLYSYYNHYNNLFHDANALELFIYYDKESIFNFIFIFYVKNSLFYSIPLKYI